MKLLLGLFFVLLILYYLHPIPLQGPNVDLGHHLLLGKIITETRNIPTINLLSFTYPNYPFINTHWLSDVIFYLFQTYFGFNGLIFLALGLMTGAFFLVFKTALKHGKILSALLVASVYLQILINRTEVKPELFSLFLLSPFIFILYKFKHKFTKWVFFLIPLEFLWVNLHLYFIVGLGVLSIFTLDAFITEKEKWRSKKFQTLFFVTLCSGLATLINPNFIKGVIFPFNFFQNYGFKVIENNNFFKAVIPYGDITFIYIGFSSLALVAGLIIIRKKVSFVDILLSAFFIFLAIFAVRNFSLFVFGTFIPAVKVLSLGLETILKRVAKQKAGKVKAIAFFLVVVIIFSGIFWNFKLHGIGFGIIDNGSEAVSFVNKNNIHGPIYNNYNIGNYLEYKLYPKERVFVDGRPEGYPKEFFEKEYYPAEGSIEGFNKVDKKYNFNVIFYEHKNQTQNANPLLNGLIKSNEWKIVYLNSSIVIFLKNNSQNEKTISKFGLTEKNTTVPGNLSNSSDYRELSNFYRVVGWFTPMFQADLKYLQYDPNNCVALRHVAIVMKNTNHPEAPIYITRYTQNCQ